MIIKHFDKLTPYELYEILKIRSSIFLIEQNCLYLDLDDKDRCSYHLFKMDEEGEIIAYLRIVDKGINFPNVSIGRVATVKNMRNKGIAKDMIEYAINFILKTESIIEISAQAHLIDFYKSLGFKENGTIYKRDDIDHINMIFNSGTIL